MPSLGSFCDSSSLLNAAIDSVNLIRGASNLEGHHRFRLPRAASLTTPCQFKDPCTEREHMNCATNVTKSSNFNLTMTTSMNKFLET